MPLPKAGEKEQHYVSRFMGAAHAQKFPLKQRLAVAYSLYRQHRGRKKSLAGAALNNPAPELLRKAYDPNQPRVPAGKPEGGEWTDEGEEYVSWRTLNGRQHSGAFIEKDNGTAIVRGADGKEYAVNDEDNTLEAMAEAKALLKSGKLHSRDKSLLKSAVERAEQGDFSDLGERLKRTRETVAKQDEENRREADASEKEHHRVARAYIEEYKTPERIRKELAKIQKERERHSRSATGSVVSFGGTHDSFRTVIDRKYRLELALAILEREGHKGLAEEFSRKSWDNTPSAYLEVPDVRQPDHYSCGAAQAMSVGRYFGVGPDSLSEWKKALGTSVKESTHPDAIVAYLSSLGLDVEAREGMTLDDLAECWAAGKPVICPVQDYGPELPEGASFTYGHYLVVLGVDKGYVVCQDSSEDNLIGKSGSAQKPGRVMVAVADWERIWHDKDAEGKLFDHYGIAVGPGGGGTKSLAGASLNNPSPALLPARAKLSDVEAQVRAELPDAEAWPLDPDGEYDPPVLRQGPRGLEVADGRHRLLGMLRWAKAKGLSADRVHFRYTTEGKGLATKGYDPDQPRVPAGVPEGGQWTADATLHTLTAEQFEHKISSSPTNAFVESHTVDWGNLRGQGKRSGYMVMGGMRDSSLQGKKTYLNPLGKLAETDSREDYAEANSLEGNDLLHYLRARAAGLNHDSAMVWVLEKQGELPKGETHRRLKESAGNKSLALSDACSWQDILAGRCGCDGCHHPGLSYKYAAVDGADAYALDTYSGERAEIDEANHAIKFVWVRQDPDGERDDAGDYTELTGIYLGDHQRNPVVYLDHGMKGFALPVGVTRSPVGEYTTWLDHDQGIGGCKAFLSRELKEGRDAFALYREGIMRAGSFGYFVNEARKLPARKAHMNAKATNLHILRCTVREISLVGMPMDPRAVVDPDLIVKALDGRFTEGSLSPCFKGILLPMLPERKAMSQGCSLAPVPELAPAPRVRPADLLASAIRLRR